MTAPMTATQIQAEARRRQRARVGAQQRGGGGWKGRLPEFLEATKIKVVNGQETRLEPFRLWEPDPWVGDAETRYKLSQRYILEQMAQERLIDFLKARQLGVTWCVCGYALYQCMTVPGYPVLALSRGLLEANEIIDRVSVLYKEHEAHKDRSLPSLPKLITDNTGELEWEGGSRILSLAATKDAGRSFTAALVILDEWAFMQWPNATLGSVKPTIDAGGQLFLISSADGQGTARHQQWNAAKAEANGYKAVFLPWFARPGRGPDWREQKIKESAGDASTVLREYPANDIEAFTHAAGLVYDVWSDGPEGGNVTESAEYRPDGGPCFWALDDGYSGERNATGFFTEKSSPRVFLLVQERSNGRLCVFYESYEIKMLEDRHLARVLLLPYDVSEIGRPAEDQSWIRWALRKRKELAKDERPCYPLPSYAAVDSSAAELRAQLHAAQIYTQGKPPTIEESIKPLRRMLAPDANGWRRILVHPRCRHLRFEMASYRRDPVTGKPIDAFNHGPDSLRQLAWTKRQEA